MISGKVHKNPRLVRKYSIPADALEDANKKDLVLLGFKMQEIATKAIQTATGGGIVYKKYNPRRTHRASAPGNAPNTDTGTLVRNINVQFRGVKRWLVAIGLLGKNADLRYGRWLEFGTKYMAARPWLTPAFRAAVNKRGTKFINAYKRRLEREQKKQNHTPPGARK